MTIQSPSVEKTEQELFDEVSAALAAGKDIGSVINNVEVTGRGEDPVTPVEPEEQEVPAATDPVAAVEPVTGADGAEVPKPEDTEPAQPALPPEVQERITKLEQEKAQFEHRFKSDLGRVAALQRKVDELSRALAAPQTAPVAEPAATSPNVAKTKFDEKIARVKELDPELADVLLALKEEALESSRRELTDKVSQTEQLFRQKEEQESWHREKARLLEMVPQADQVFSNPLWREWKESQTPGVLALASSSNADEMYLAMQKFAADTARMYPELASPADAAPAPAAPAAVSPSVNKLLDDRARKLSVGNPAPQSVAPKQGRGIPGEDDPNALFEYVVAKLQKGEPLKL